MMYKKEEDTEMSKKIKTKRPCSVSESIIQSCKEVKGMREGVIPERSLRELFDNIEEWSREERR